MACCFTKYACLDTTEFTEEENLYLLQLLDDVNSNRQLTDIFTFLMCRLPSVVWISFRQRVTHTHTQTLGVFFLCSSLSFFRAVFYSRRTEREMCGFISSGKECTHEFLSLGPSTALANSQIRSTKHYRSRV